MSGGAPSATALRVSDLSAQGARFSLSPSAADLSTFASELGLDALRKLSFSGSLAPSGKSDWRLTGKLGATIEQTCSVTLAPVRTRIDVDVTRLFLAEYDLPEAPEVEMPEDDSTEPLGRWIDPEAVMLEALSLEIPAYPRAPDAAFDGAQYAEDGVTPMRDEDARPFAGLAALRDKMRDDEP